MDHHHVDCNAAKGTASTKMVETVDTEQKWNNMCVEKMTDQNQAQWSRHDACFSAKLMQIDM